jgi:phage tail tube protein FII
VPNPVLVMDYANMFCGSAPEDDGASNHLTLASVELPSLEVQYVDHRPGGAPVSVEIDVIQTRMEVRFELIGITRQVMQLLYGHQRGAENFFIYGNVRDWLSGETLQLEARVRGQLGLVDPQPFDRGGEAFHVQYAIRGIMAYELNFGDGARSNGGSGQMMPIYEWNFFTNVWAVGGINQNGMSTTGTADMQFNLP